ncbi:MAG TPA: winged helix-turn-helix domain-containing protein, partial [Tissierellaceae bacterium]|nr:winged helix-turn-helix domain-containing protein [Tissierellaceae bacterium]
MTFLKETSMLKELRLLQHIESYPNTTQKQIAKAIDSAPSMVNAYIDNLEKKQYLKRVYKSAKNVSYH